jgi:hypothetical protein
MQQRSLFPDGFEVQEAALAALRELRVEKALSLVRCARAIDASMPGIAALQRALEWLAARVDGEPDVGQAGEALTALATSSAMGELDASAVALVETGIATFVSARRPAGPVFLDAEQTVSSARIDLLRGDAGAARAGAEQLLGAGFADRAALWFDHADACWVLQRPGEANASYVRALLLGPRDGHVHRCRCEPLAAVWRGLVGASFAPAAADLLLAQAWIAGALTIPPGTTWLSAAQRALVRERSEQSAAWRFSLLVYLDRSARAGECDVASREEMLALLPDVFEQFVAAVRRRQG